VKAGEETIGKDRRALAGPITPMGARGASFARHAARPGREYFPCFDFNTYCLSVFGLVEMPAIGVGPVGAYAGVLYSPKTIKHHASRCVELQLGLSTIKSSWRLGKQWKSGGMTSRQRF
jgi:hypothetical protein